MIHYIHTIPGSFVPEPEIIVGKPPNFDKIKETFTLSGNEIFAWDGIIYSPDKNIPRWLIEHEKVHFKQQDGEPEKWWNKYLVDSEFRLEQEIPAHQVEFKWYCKEVKDRNRRFGKKLELAKRLASDMYGNMTTIHEAMKHLK